MPQARLNAEACPGQLSNLTLMKLQIFRALSIREGTFGRRSVRVQVRTDASTLTHMVHPARKGASPQVDTQHP